MILTSFLRYISIDNIQNLYHYYYSRCSGKVHSLVQPVHTSTARTLTMPCSLLLCSFDKNHVPLNFFPRTYFVKQTPQRMLPLQLKSWPTNTYPTHHNTLLFPLSLTTISLTNPLLWEALGPNIGELTVKKCNEK